MAKGFIVMNVPDKCEKCPIEKRQGEDIAHWCPIVYARYVDHIRDEGRPDWCPIRPMPEKKELLGDSSFCSGWNACINKLLKG